MYISEEQIDVEMRKSINRKCLSCQKPFNIYTLVDKKNLKNAKYLIPYMWPCGHSICKFCLINKIPKNDSITCNFCEENIVLTEQQKSILDKNEILLHFPIDLSCIGYIYYTDNVDKVTWSSNNEYTKEALDKYVQFENFPKKNLSNHKCENCTQNASVYCKECKFPLCDKCFEKIHDFKALQRHSRLNIDYTEYFSSDPKCESHKQSLDNYCEDCCLFVCTECYKDSDCKNHNVLNAQIKEESMEADLLNKQKILSVILENIDSSVLKINLELKRSIGYNSNRRLAEKKISQHYLQSHAKLYFEEHEIFKKLDDIDKSETSAWNKALKNIEKDKTKVSTLSRLIDDFLKPELRSEVCLVKLDKCVQNALGVHCVFVRNRTFNDILDENLNYESLVESINTWDNLPTLYKLSKISGDSLPSSNLNGNLIDDLTLVPIDDLKILDTNMSIWKIEKTPLTSGSAVSVIHIKSCREFFVCPVELMETFNEMNDILNKEYNNGLNARLQPHQIRAKSLVVYRDETIGWCRAYIKSHSIQEVNIKLIDYNFDRSTGLQNLRPMTKKLFSYKQMIKRCTLDVNVKKECFDDALKLFKLFLKSELFKIDIVKKMFAKSYCVNLYCTIKGETVSLATEYNNRNFTIEKQSQEPKLKNVAISDVNVKMDDMLKDPIGKKESSNNKLKNVINKEESNDNKLYVRVLSIINPSNFFIKFINKENAVKRMINDIQICCEESVSKLDLDLKMSKIYAVCTDLKKRWQRAKVCDINHEKKSAKVFLIDEAEYLEVEFNAIRKLPEDIAKLEAGAVKCSLANITRAVEGSNWPTVTIEYFQEIINKNHKFYIEKCNEINDCLIVQLWVEHITLPGALVASVTEWKTVSDLILEQGLAIRAAPKCLSTLNDDSKNSKKILKRVVETPKLELVTKWLPPDPPTERYLKATPTFVDDDMTIYLHVSDMHKSNLVFVDNVIHKKFHNSTPRDEDMFWAVGQPCAAPFNNNYYRGVIEKILPDNEYHVRFVDYGNVELIHINGLRKIDITEKIPIQSLKCQLLGIKPILSSDIASHIHKLIVEKTCNVTIIGVKPSGAIGIHLKMNNMDLVDYMVNEELAHRDQQIELESLERINIRNGSDDDDDIVYE